MSVQRSRANGAESAIPALGAAREVTPRSSADQTPKFAVRHYSVAEIAALWSLSVDLVRQLFEKEPGVLVLGHTEEADRTRVDKRTGKVERVTARRYTTLRIPDLRRHTRQC